jgi:hypothetical protein
VKERYEKPAVETESAFETLAAGCTFYTSVDDQNCGGIFGGQELNSE